MRRSVAVLVTLALALVAGVMSAQPAAAGPTSPTVTSVNTTPDRFVFSSNTSLAATLTMELDEPANWRLAAARFKVCDTGRFNGCSSSSERWLKLTSNESVLQRRTLTFKGSIPNIDPGTGLPVRSGWVDGPDTLVSLTYVTPNGTQWTNNQFVYFDARGDTRVSLTGPSKITPGQSLTLNGKVDCFVGTSYQSITTGTSMRVATYVEFLRDGDTTWNSMGMLSETGTYFNLAVGASGTWRISFYSEFGCNNETASLHVEASSTQPPPPPKLRASAPHAEVTGKTYNTVSIDWSEPDEPNGTISGYRWGWTSANGLPQKTWDWVFQADNGIPNPFVMTNLAPSNEYTMWVEAITENGTGKRRTFKVKTNAAPRAPITVPSAPRSLKVSSSSTSAKLSWTAPAEEGGAVISGYQVTGPRGATLKASARSYTYSGLKPLRSYRLSVRAKNVKGWSAWSGVTVATKAAAPKAYKTCAALNGDYPHGVGKAGAVDRTSGVRVTTFYRSNTAYAMNDGRVKSKKQYDLDYDNDGIACEKR